MEIKVKNMVCNRCIMVVKQIFERAGLAIVNAELGTVQTKEELTSEQINFIDQELTKAGFEIISDQSARLVEQIKTITINYVYKSEDMENVTFSSYLSAKLNKDYGYLSTLFSSLSGITISFHFSEVSFLHIGEYL